MPNIRTRLAAPTGIEEGNVNREKGIISNVAVITQGEALGHDLWIDEVFLKQTVKAGNEGPKGVKSRFTHPGLSADGLAKYLGREKKFKLDGARVLADLHLSEKVAGSSPDGDLYTYTLNYAEEDPESFGQSIVFYRDWGEENRYMAQYEDEDGHFKSPDTENVNNYPHARLADLDAVDLVGDPAANDKGLFTRGNALAAEAENLANFVLGIEENQPVPELAMFGDIQPEKVREWLNMYFVRNNLAIIKQEERKMAEKKPETQSSPSELIVAEVDVEKLASNAMTEGKDKGRKAEQERFKALKEKFSDRPDFVVAQFEKGSTIEQAASEFNSLRIAELEKENEDLKKSNPKTKTETGAAPVDFDGESESVNLSNPVELLKAGKALAAEKGIPLAKAMSELAPKR